MGEPLSFARECKLRLTIILLVLEITITASRPVLVALAVVIGALESSALGLRWATRRG